MDVMGDFRKLLVSWVAAIMAIVLAAKTAWELFTLAMSPRDSLQDYLWAAFYWFVLFVATSFIAIFLARFNPSHSETAGENSIKSTDRKSVV